METEPEAEAGVPPPSATEPRLSPAEVNAMKVTELRAALKARGLDDKGKKAQLVERLLASL